MIKKLITLLWCIGCISLCQLDARAPVRRQPLPLPPPETPLPLPIIEELPPVPEPYEGPTQPLPGPKTPLPPPIKELELPPYPQEIPVPPPPPPIKGAPTPPPLPPRDHDESEIPAPPPPPPPAPAEVKQFGGFLDELKTKGQGGLTKPEIKDLGKKAQGSKRKGDDFLLEIVERTNKKRKLSEKEIDHIAEAGKKPAEKSKFLQEIEAIKKLRPVSKEEKKKAPADESEIMKALRSTMESRRMSIDDDDDEDDLYDDGEWD